MKIIKYIIYILFLLIFLFSIYIIPQIIPNYNDFFSKNTNFYFFSALLQANAAILSIIGVFFIFKIQTFQTNIIAIKNAVMSDMGLHSTPTQIVEFDNLSLNEKKERVQNGNYSVFINRLLLDWINNLESINKIKKYVYYPVIVFIIGIIIDMFGIVFSNYIHNSGFYFEVKVIYFSFVYELFILFFLVKVIIKIL